jgi:hypothetical protein
MKAQAAMINTVTNGNRSVGLSSCSGMTMRPERYRSPRPSRTQVPCLYSRVGSGQGSKAVVEGVDCRHHYGNGDAQRELDATHVTADSRTLS